MNWWQHWGGGGGGDGAVMCPGGTAPWSLLRVQTIDPLWLSTWRGKGWPGARRSVLAANGAQAANASGPAILTPRLRHGHPLV